MNNEVNASTINDEVNNTPGTNPSYLKKFVLKQDGPMLQLNLKDASDNGFTSGMLITLSNAIKSLTAPNEEESKIAFHFDGRGEAAAGMCLGSSGLWESEFCFSKDAEEAKFIKMREDCLT